MDKAQALHQFWSSFGLPAIDEQSAYDTFVLEQLGIDYPYITYEVASGNVSGNVPMTASLWYRSTNWAEISQKAEEIADFIGYGGRVYKVDRGYMCIMLPEGQVYFRSPDETGDVRRIVFNIEVLFATAT